MGVAVLSCYTSMPRMMIWSHGHGNLGKAVNQLREHKRCLDSSYKLGLIAERSVHRAARRIQSCRSHFAMPAPYT
jgi:hypothetical protein